MLNLSLHIEYLLRTHSCVILPGIGAFLRTHRPATFDEANDIFEAPADVYSFNSSIVTDDGLLAHSVARHENCSYEQAAVAVADEIEFFKQVLREEGELTIGKVGILLNHEDGRLTFQPGKRYKHALTTPISVTAFKGIDNTTEEARYEESAHDPKYIYLRIPRMAVKVAAMIGIVMLVGSLFMTIPSSVSTSTPAKTYSASVVPTVKQTEDVPAVVEEISVENTQNDTPEAIEPVDENEFYIIVATFRNTQDCETFISQQSNPEGLQVICSGKACRVACASASTREELVELMRTNDIRARFSQAWIWQQP